MPLIRSILAATGNAPERKASLIVADPKNELAPFMQEVLASVGRADDLIVLKPGSATYNPLGSPFLANDNEMVEKIISFANHTNRQTSTSRRNDPFWDNAQRGLLAAIVAAARVLHGPQLSFALLDWIFRKIDRFKSTADAARWMEEKKLPDSAVNGIRDFLQLPHDTTRPCVATSVANVLYFWNHHPLAQLVMPKEGVPAIDPLDIVHQGKVLIIGCSGPAFGVSITPLLLSLKEHFFATLLSRDQIEVEGNREWKLINQERPVFFIADEFQSYLSPDASMGELTALDRLRGFKAGYLAATQNLASLHSVLGDMTHATRLISLFSNQSYLANICPITASQAGHILGKKKVRERQILEHASIAPPLLMGHDAWRRRKTTNKEAVVLTREVPSVDASTLSALRSGEFWFRMANGKVVKGKASPA